VISVRIESLDTGNVTLCQSAWKCYQSGYAGEPWNEHKKCSGCENSFGSSIGEAETCPQCGSHLELFWPLETIASDVLGSLDLPYAYCAVAVAGDEVVGMLLGYALAVPELESHLGLPVHGLVGDALVAYNDEVVVRPDWQGKGIGRELYAGWMEHIQVSGLRQVAARTQSDPPTVVYGWYQRQGYEVIASYPNPDMRVVLGRSV